MNMTGVCPECEFEFIGPNLHVGETLSCPECALTLQIQEIVNSSLLLQMIEAELPDWGQ